MRISKRVPSPDGISMKYLQETDDGFLVEATYIKQPERHTLCVSTQVGCPIGCTFCASGLRGKSSPYQRSLTSAEMVEECRLIANGLDFASHPKPLTFAFMGEGEPFLNFWECVGAFHTLSTAAWPVPLRLSVSTSGIRPNLIRRLGKIMFPVHFKLQISLHGPTDEIRSRLVPRSKPIAEIVAAVRAYWDKCHRPVVWNYVMCADVNDGENHAEQLAELLGPGWRIKLTRLNAVAGLPFHPAPREQIERFRRILEKHGLFTSYSETDESRIGSGCGQLSYQECR